MKIDEVISHLERIRLEFGNLPVTTEICEDGITQVLVLDKEGCELRDKSWGSGYCVYLDA